MLEKMNKVLKAIGVIGVTFFILSILIAVIGFCINSENVFYAGLTFLIFGCPACFVIWLILFYVVMILEEKAEKKGGNRDEG